MLTVLAFIAYVRSKHLGSDYLSPLFRAFIMALEDRFSAAVRVIQTLPKDGPYQPSNSTKLRFYSLFKQGTEGKCTQGKPNVWNVVARAKWEAWNRLGDMDKNDAMAEYIEELKKIVETMSFSGDVQEFLDSIGPFYEFVNLEGPEMNHIKAALDNITSSSSSLSNSTTSSPNNSPAKTLVESQESPVEIPEKVLTNGYASMNGNAPGIKKSNGYLPSLAQVADPAKTSSASNLFTAPPAPVHRASLKNTTGLSNGHIHSENENSDEVLEIDEVSHEYQIHHSHGKVSVDSLHSGTESDKYYSGDSEPEVDIEEKYAAMAARSDQQDSHALSNGFGSKSRTRSHVGPFNDGEDVHLCSGMNTITGGHQSSEFVLHNTVERLNRDVDHILARLRILEAAYAANGQMSGPGLGPSSQLRRKRWFGELSPRSLTLIITWPFVAYFIIKLLKWWFTRRFHT